VHRGVEDQGGKSGCLYSPLYDFRTACKWYNKLVYSFLVDGISMECFFCHDLNLGEYKHANKEQ